LRNGDLLRSRERKHQRRDLGDDANRNGGERYVYGSGRSVREWHFNNRYQRQHDRRSDSQ
jgi:hypothetical protein